MFKYISFVNIYLLNNEFMCLLSDFDNIQHSLGPDCPTDGGDVCKLFLKYVEKFKLPNLANYLKRLVHFITKNFLS